MSVYHKVVAPLQLWSSTFWKSQRIVHVIRYEMFRRKSSLMIFVFLNQVRWNGWIQLSLNVD